MCVYVCGQLYAVIIYMTFMCQWAKQRDEVLSLSLYIYIYIYIYMKGRKKFANCSKSEQNYEDIHRHEGGGEKVKYNRWDIVLFL